jgi:hypothetical protein
MMPNEEIRGVVYNACVLDRRFGLKTLAGL